MNTESQEILPRVSNNLIRESRALWRGIEAYEQREFMALSDEQMEAAGHAYRSCLMAHLPEYQCETGKRVHMATLARFAALCGSPTAEWRG